MQSGMKRRCRTAVNLLLFTTADRVTKHPRGYVMSAGVESGDTMAITLTLHTEYCYSCRSCRRLFYSVFTMASRPCQEGCSTV